MRPRINVDVRPRRPFELVRPDRRRWRARSSPQGQTAGRRHLVLRNPHHRAAPSPSHDAARGITETFTDVELALAWPSISQELRRHRPLHLARRSRSSAITLTRFRGGAGRRPLRPQAAARRRAVQARLRRHMSQQPTLKIEGTLAADAPVAARHAALGRPASRCPAAASAASRSRRKTNVTGGNDCTVRASTSSSTAMSPRACWPSPPTAAQTLQGTLAADELDLTPYVSTVRAAAPATSATGTAGRSRSTASAASISICGCRRRASRSARAKLGRTAIAANLRGGQLTRDDRRVAGLRRRAQGLAGAGRIRSRRRSQVATAVHRRRSRNMPRRVVRHPPARRRGDICASRSRRPATACWR